MSSKPAADGRSARPDDSTSSSGGELRERILDAAIHLFAERGYGSTSVRQVVEAVGCTKPALYYHFGSKEDLYLEAVRSTMERVTGLFEETLARPGTMYDRLRRFVDTLIERVRKNPSGMRLLMTAEHQPADQGKPQVDLLSLHREHLRLLTELMQEGVASGELRADVPVEEIALGFIGMVNIRALGCLHGLPHGPDATRRLLDLFFNGVRPADGPSPKPPRSEASP